MPKGFQANNSNPAAGFNRTRYPWRQLWKLGTFLLATGNLKGASVIPGELPIETDGRDDVLLRRSAKGDQDAFAQLYRRYQAPLFRFALRMTGNSWAAEEIVQEVFMTVIREPGKFDPNRGTLGAFLYGVARNRIMKHIERTPRDLPLAEKTEDGFSTDTLASKDMTPVEWAELHERRAQVRAAVLELPSEFREAIILCELEEMSYEEAANAMDCPVGTIRSRLHRGRALLLAKLEMLREVPRRANAGR
ncbi:MAG TPA: sigma-70 family RNA polymerase sigma factor [Dongiaceae bacterium]|nr:sigma-70 family RNA polymerase sigma factor [Dongiaceae bacterium]